MIFPIPKEEVYENGIYIMKNYEANTDIVYLFEKYKNGDCDLKIKNNLTFGKEEYELVIDDCGITVTASCHEGIFRAITSLKQLIEIGKGTLRYCKVSDSPDFENRCYLLDVSYGRMPKVEIIKRYIDYIAGLKYNEFQLFFESLVYDYEAYKDCTKDFQCYTPQDIKEINEYCKERYIKLVPYVASFGHLRAWLNLDRFKHLRVGDDETNTATINPFHPETMDFLDGFYASLFDLCDSSGVANVGFDESAGLGLYQTEEICKEKGKEWVFVNWLNKVADHVREKYGRRCQYFTDMIHGFENEDYVLENVPKDGIAVVWGYDPIPTASMEKWCMSLEKHGVPFYVCPSSSTWCSGTGRMDVCHMNLQILAEVGRSHGAVGYMYTDWGSGDGHNSFPVWNFYPAALGGQYAWNAGAKQDRYMFKTDFIKGAREYTDKVVFEGKPISELMYRLGQYYLLEPQRTPGGTSCMKMIGKPLCDSSCGSPLYGGVDYQYFGDDFYFDNLESYMKKAIGCVEETEFDENYKRQILVNSYQALIGIETARIRYHRGSTPEKIDEIIKMIDDNLKEYEVLWDRENFPKGKENFMVMLEGRRSDLVELKEMGCVYAEPETKKEAGFMDDNPWLL